MRTTTKTVLGLAALAIVAAIAAFLIVQGSKRSRRGEDRGASPQADERARDPVAGEPGAAGEEEVDPAAFRLFGTVSDEKGNPVPGAEVAVLGRFESWSEEVAAVPADPAGRFELHGSEAAQVQLAARAPGFLLWRGGADPLHEREVAVELKRGAHLRVRVVAANREPVAGATVRSVIRVHEGVSGLWGSTRWVPHATAETDEQGWADLGQAPAGSFEISAAEPRYAPSSTRLELTGTAAVEAEVVLAEGGAIEGRVLGRTGLPIAGARVRVWEHPTCTATSGPDGSYRLEGVPEEAVTVVARAEDHGRGFFGEAAGWGDEVALSVRTGQTATDVDIILDRACHARGRIVDDLGRPVEGVRIYGYTTITQGGVRHGLAQDRHYESGKDGRFRAGPFRRMGETTLYLWFDKEGHFLDSFDVDVGDTREDLELGDIEALRAGAVAGVVVDTEGVRVDRGRVWLGSGRRAFPIRPDGGFLVDGLEPGRVLLCAEGVDSTRSVLASVEVESGVTTEDVVLSLLPVRAIAGRVVTPDGDPREGVEVAAVPMEGLRLPGGYLAWSRTDEHGRFVLTDLPRGAYRVGLAAIRGWSRGVGPLLQGLRKDPAPVEVEESSEADLEFELPLPGPVVSGRVLDGATGRPVPEYTVTAIRYEWFVPSGFTSFPHRSGDGSFRSVLDEGGTYAVEVKAAGFAPLRTDRFSARAGERKDLGELRLPAGGSISGIVKDAQGRPVPYARIHVLSATMETNEEAPFADLDGRYEVPAIAPGTYRVFAVSPRHPLGMVSDVRVVEGKPTAVDFALEPAAPVTLVVLDEGGRPLEGAEVSYTFDAIRPLTSNMIASYEPPAWGADRTDGAGRLTKPCLPATEVAFTVEAEGFSRVTRAERLTAGKPARIEFRLERRG